MERDEVKLNKNRNKGAIAFTLIMTLFGIFYARQEYLKTQKLDRCSFYTICNPIRFSDSYTMYFYFEHNSKRYDEQTSVGGDDVGLHWSNEDILNKRYWLKVNCNDFKTNRVIWDIPVPDTLKFVPANGWDKIPYGLDKK